MIVGEIPRDILSPSILFTGHILQLLADLVFKRPSHAAAFLVGLLKLGQSEMSLGFAFWAMGHFWLPQK